MEGSSQFVPEPCVLHLDILELIVHEHRNDHATLAATALASQSLLQIARKFLYRSVSLDYCENPYGYEQQRRLRASLAGNTHLCSYIRALRFSLPSPKAQFDPLLVAILRGLTRLETLHLIGAGMQGAVVSDGHYTVSAANFNRDYHSGRSANDHRSQHAMTSGAGFAGGSVDGALMHVFGLKSLKKVVLENIYPLEEWHVGRFEGLKHLELVSVGGGPPTEEGLMSTIDSSVSGLNALASTSSLAGLGNGVAGATTTTAGTDFTSGGPVPGVPSNSIPGSSLSPHLPTTQTHFLPAPALPENASSSPQTNPNPRVSPSSVLPFATGNMDGGGAYLTMSQRQQLSGPGPGSQAQVPQDRRGTQGEEVTEVGVLPGTSDPDPVSLAMTRDGRATHNVFASCSSPVAAWSEGSGKGIGIGAAGSSGVGEGLFGRCAIRNDGFGVEGKGKGKGKGRSKRVRLEHLVLNLERLRPVLDVIHPASGNLADGQERTRRLGEGDGSILDFSALKQAHIYVWDPDDTTGIWEILCAARMSLERLTLRYFHYGDEYTRYHAGFDNLHSLVLGTHTFSSVREDPFRPLLLFFQDAREKLPSLRKVKISFDLWGCESSGASWKEVAGYRGWGELDELFSTLDIGNRDPQMAYGEVGVGDSIHLPRQLESIVFEVWCSVGYKSVSRTQQRLQRQVEQLMNDLRGTEKELTEKDEGKSLLEMIREELPYLGRCKTFIIL